MRNFLENPNADPNLVNSVENNDQTNNREKSDRIMRALYLAQDEISKIYEVKANSQYLAEAYGHKPNEELEELLAEVYMRLKSLLSNIRSMDHPNFTLSADDVNNIREDVAEFIERLRQVPNADSDTAKSLEYILNQLYNATS
jgi:hypothetical protein